MSVTSPYDDLTPETIKAKMLADFKVHGETIDTREGSYTNTLVSVAAYQLYRLYQEFPSLLYMAFPDDTSGEYIDKNAEQIGMFRNPGVKAVVEVTFTGTDGTFIPAKTALYAPESGLQYLTTKDATIASGTVTVPAEAAEVGADYNLNKGEISSMYINVAGVISIENKAAATGGADPESDVDFYARYHARRTLPITSGNKNHYITWATEVPGVSYASCIPLWAGNGTVKVVIAGADRGPVDEDIRSACAQHIEDNRPIGATVTVVSVTKRQIALSAKITLVKEYTTENVKSQLSARVNELLANQPFGESITIPYSRFLACLLQCPGVADYSTFTVDGGTAAITIKEHDAATVGTVIIS